MSATRAMSSDATEPVLPALDFWFEFGSNYSYLSVMRIEQEAARLTLTRLKSSAS